MQKREYNGWHNYETWCANLWMTNDQGGAESLEESARQCLQDAIDSNESDIRESATHALAAVLESQHEEMAEEWMPDQSSFFADLLNAGMREVNWYEIAEHAIGDIALYSAGWNMPGYMPDSDPAVFLDADGAREYVADQMESAIEESGDFGNEKNIEVSVAAIDECRIGSGEYGATFGNYHYFVTRI